MTRFEGYSSEYGPEACLKIRDQGLKLYSKLDLTCLLLSFHILLCHNVGRRGASAAAGLPKAICKPWRVGNLYQGARRTFGKHRVTRYETAKSATDAGLGIKGRHAWPRVIVYDLNHSMTIRPIYMTTRFIHFTHRSPSRATLSNYFSQTYQTFPNG